ncbi:MAG: hypothetical protein LBK25_09110 [Treponema sp.]|nr:hypothetical protein [Treponema sp.]
MLLEKMCRCPRLDGTTLAGKRTQRENINALPLSVTWRVCIYDEEEYT